ncbi:CBF/Mak21 family-domain-containing protein [Russula brevipes]|nr:CBF/Mak21 family-domain-containing protein [Russula brevipes]
MAPPSSSLSLSGPRRKRIKLQDDSRIKQLEDELTESVSSNASLNSLADLTSLATSLDEPHSVLKAIYACYRVFVLLVSKGRLETSTDEKMKVVRTWVLERLDEYVRFLCGLLHDEESLLRIVPHPQFNVPHFKKFLGALEQAAYSGATPGKLDAEVRDRFVTKWLNTYADVRWFFLRDADSILSSSLKTNPHVPENLLSLLEKLESFPVAQSDLTSWWVEELQAKPARPKKKEPTGAEPDDSGTDHEPNAAEDDDDDDDWRKFFDEVEKPKKSSEPSMRLHQMSVHQSLHSLASHRAVFTRLWLRLLPRLSDDERTKSAFMHHGAVLVMDWVGGCVDCVIHIQPHDRDYPSFYTCLYAFLDQDLLHLKYRSRFFRLTELFLSSTHLPATLLASFVKRLSRLSLAASPPAPCLMCMIHRDGEVSAPIEDPFLAEEPNPNLTNALDSSLWELYSHKNHYHAGVSTLARIFEEAFTKPSYPMEDFLITHTLRCLIEGELKRRIKKDPAVETDEPDGIFKTRDDGQLDSRQNIVESLWTF